MADKELESPKEWVKTDGVNRTNEQPNGTEETNPFEKPTIFKEDVVVEGDLYIKGEKYEAPTDELPPTTEASAGQVLKLDSNKKPKWQNDTAGMSNPMTTAGDLIVGGTDGAPARLPKGETGQVLKVGETGLEWGSAGGGGGGIDTDVTIEIESNYSSTDYANRNSYADPITLQQFIANCEAGDVYTNAGIIAKVNNLLNNKAFRLILIGTNHEVLAYDDTTTAKTTWQFLDMPEHNVRLGLPFNLLDWDSGGNSRAKLKAYLEGTNESTQYLYPSNMDGLISAQGLLEACHTIFEELPDTLKRHIKTVRRYYNRKRNYFTVNASTEGNPGSESNSAQMCQLACNVFHLAGTDLGTSGASGEGSGSKYNYFAGSAQRIRFYNGSAAGWWTASPYTSFVRYWYFVSDSGYDNDYFTNHYSGVAPAFCI